MVRGILDRFELPSSGHAFFPGGTDDTLADALMDAGWSIYFDEGDYVYAAAHPVSGAVFQHVEDDLYCLLEGKVA